MAAALQRLTTGSKSFSERHLSLTERPTAPERRLDKTYHCQWFALSGERRFRKCDRECNSFRIRGTGVGRSMWAESGRLFYCPVISPCA